jgi:predicted ribonuclease YlaK
MVQKANENGVHEYKFEIDVIASAGPEEGLARLASQGNTVYLDLKEIERRGAEDSTDRSRFEYQNTLAWINDLPFEKPGLFNRRVTPTGGIISSEEAPQQAVHITRSPSTRSRIERGGGRVDFPRFLEYSMDPLRSGLIDITSNRPKEVSIEEVLNNAEIEQLYPHQFVRVNGALLYRVEQRLTPNQDRSRYRLEGEPTLHYIGPIDQFHVAPKVRGFKPRDIEQALAYAQMVEKMGDDFKTDCCFVTGGSSSGKTVVVYAAALDLALGKQRGKQGAEERTDSPFEGIILFKPTTLIGGKENDQGARPGSLLEKLRPFIESFADAHKALSLNGEAKFKQMLLDPEEEVDIDSGLRAKNVTICGYHLPPRDPLIRVEYLAFARGRTFPNAVVFIDEAQNFTPYEMKQLIERMGVGTKIIISGDPNQVDNARHLDEKFNGLVFAAHALRDEMPRLSFMHLTKNYRHQAAEVMRRKRAPRTL